MIAMKTERIGLATGERLNEHVTGLGFPARRVRHERLRETLEIIRLLWQGGYRSYDGRHLKLEVREQFACGPDAPLRALTPAAA